MGGAGYGVNAYLVDQSGNPVSLSLSGGFVVAGYDYVSGQFRTLAVDGSGQLNVAVTVVDQITIGGISSGTVAVQSGEIHVMSGSVTLGSGGANIGNVTVASGNVISSEAAWTLGRGRKGQPITAASGGDLLLSGDVRSVTIRYHPMVSSGAALASGFVYVGFDATGERPIAISGFPTSSWGILLTPGDSITIPIQNMNLIRAAATLSGDVISYYGNQY